MAGASITGVSDAILTDSSAAQRAADCVDSVEVPAIRAALGQYPSVAAPGTDRRSTTLNTVAGRLAYVEHAWSSSHFTVVSQHLPRLLGDAQAVVLTTSAADLRSLLDTTSGESGRLVRQMAIRAGLPA